MLKIRFLPVAIPGTETKENTDICSRRIEGESSHVS
jgi:hypothetical protein